MADRRSRRVSVKARNTLLEVGTSSARPSFRDTSVKEALANSRRQTSINIISSQQSNLAVKSLITRLNLDSEFETPEETTSAELGG